MMAGGQGTWWPGLGDMGMPWYSVGGCDGLGTMGRGDMVAWGHGDMVAGGWRTWGHGGMGMEGCDGLGTMGHGDAVARGLGT